MAVLLTGVIVTLLQTFQVEINFFLKIILNHCKSISGSNIDMSDSGTGVNMSRVTVEVILIGVIGTLLLTFQE